jgi:hypothetical protein
MLRFSKNKIFTKIILENKESNEIFEDILGVKMESSKLIN